MELMNDPLIHCSDALKRFEGAFVSSAFFCGYFLGVFFWLVADAAFKLIGRRAVFNRHKAALTNVLSARACLYICFFLHLNPLFFFLYKTKRIYPFLRIGLRRLAKFSQPLLSHAKTGIWSSLRACKRRRQTVLCLFFLSIVSKNTAINLIGDKLNLPVAYQLHERFNNASDNQKNSI
jgi:hypothetical protein